MSPAPPTKDARVSEGGLWGKHVVTHLRTWASAPCRLVRIERLSECGLRGRAGQEKVTVCTLPLPARPCHVVSLGLTLFSIMRSVCRVCRNNVWFQMNRYGVCCPQHVLRGTTRCSLSKPRQGDAAGSRADTVPCTLGTQSSPASSSLSGLSKVRATDRWRFSLLSRSTKCDSLEASDHKGKISPNKVSFLTWG